MLPYFLERMPLRIFGPLAVALAFPAHLPRPSGAGALALDTAFGLLLLAQFRLWDDLADRRADASAHPDRVLVRVSSAVPFAALCAALGAGNMTIAIARSGTALALPLLAGISVALALLYARPHIRSIGGELAKLAKYPAFVLIVAAGRWPGWSDTALMGAAAAYLSACAWEAWHDPSTPLRISSWSSRCRAR